MIAEAIAAQLQEPQSLWVFLATSYGSIAAQVSGWSAFWCVLGLFGNYAVRWSKDEIVGSLWCYLYHQNVRRTVLSMMSCISAVVALMMSNEFYIDGVFVGWIKVAYTSFGVGFLVDNVVNKGERKEWSPQERDAKAIIAAADNHPKVPILEPLNVAKDAGK